MRKVADGAAGGAEHARTRRGERNARKLARRPSPPARPPPEPRSSRRRHRLLSAHPRSTRDERRIAGPATRAAHGGRRRRGKRSGQSSGGARLKGAGEGARAARPNADWRTHDAADSQARREAATHPNGPAIEGGVQPVCTTRIIERPVTFRVKERCPRYPFGTLGHPRRRRATPPSPRRPTRAAPCCIIRIRGAHGHPVGARHQTQAVEGQVGPPLRDGDALEGWAPAGDGQDGRDAALELSPCGTSLLCQGRRQASWRRPHRMW